MSPAGYGSKTGTRRIRFLTGVGHEGKDYGPELEEDEADVNPVDALQYVQQGRAVYIDVSEEEAVDGTIIPDQEIVIGGGSSVRAVVGGGAINIDGPDDEILPEDFPDHVHLAKANITTYGQLRAIEDHTQIPGIGPERAKEIRKALKARPQPMTPRPLDKSTGLDTKSGAAIVNQSKGK